MRRHFWLQVGLKTLSEALPQKNIAKTIFGCRQGDDGWLQGYLDTTMPLLLSDARKSAKKLAANPPSFSPVSSWTTLSQLHGPRVSPPIVFSPASPTCLCCTFLERSFLILMHFLLPELIDKCLCKTISSRPPLKMASFQC